MNIIDGNYKSADNKEYFSAVINKQLKTVRIVKNFSCTAAICNYLETEFNICRNVCFDVFNITFLGDNIDLNRIPKKYSTWIIL